MAKLYIFGIGGTGSRVIKSLALLLASGVTISSKFKTIVPIIVDPDSANGDLNRTTDILAKYQEIQKIVNKGAHFFGTEIKTLQELTDENTPIGLNNFKFSIEGTTNETFEDFLNYNALSPDNKALIDLLYSPSDLKLQMDVGFKGNPNIGSIVLNQFKQSKEFKDFANTFQEGDAIFIVSSIFGGTGASGFPLLLKNLRQDDVTIPNAKLINESKIGAISFLPYYKINLPHGEAKQTIDSSLFYGKAKAALSYYEHSIFKNKSLDAFYYLGDNSSKTLEHHDGKAAQKNPAHFLELAGAMAVLDFMNKIEKVDRKSNPLFLEFGVDSESNGNLNFSDLGKNLKASISKPLSQFMLFNNYMTNFLDEALHTKDTWHKSGNTEEGKELFGQDFYTQNFYKDFLAPFFSYYTEWIEEMEQNDISFTPFREQKSYAELLNFIEDYEVKNSIFSKKASAKILGGKLNELVDHTKYETKEERMIKLFSDATKLVINDIIK